MIIQLRCTNFECFDAEYKVFLKDVKMILFHIIGLFFWICPIKYSLDEASGDVSSRAES